MGAGDTEKVRNCQWRLFTNGLALRGEPLTQAKVRIKRNGAIIHQESPTFEKKRLAELWARKREAELDQPGAIAQLRFRGITVGQVLKVYQEQFSSVRQSGRSQNADLKRLQQMPIAALDAVTLTHADGMDHLMAWLTVDKVKPQTASHDLAWLRVA